MSGPSIQIVTEQGASWEGVPSVEVLSKLIVLATYAKPDQGVYRAIDLWDLSRRVAALMPDADVAAAVSRAKVEW
jgi:hypothetical protein